jgi:membrane protease subunit HflC
MKKVVTVLVVVAVLLILFLVMGPFYILQEGEQAVVVQFGKIVRKVTDAGLKSRVPFVDTVVKYPKKILSWDGEAQRIPTAENQFIWVDTTARWRINNIERFYASIGTITNAHSRLDDVVDSSSRKIIARNSLREAVRNSNVIREIERTNVYAGEGGDEEGIEEAVNVFQAPIFENVRKGRTILSDEMFAEVKDIVPQYGIELIDIIIRQIKYSDELTESVYRRMIADRNQIAQAFRSDGEGKKAAWMGEMGRELNVIRSEAYRLAETTKGKADAQAAQIYAEVYRENPEFYTFWKSLDSYRMMLPKFRKTLSTDAEYFKYLYNPEGR